MNLVTSGIDIGIANMNQMVINCISNGNNFFMVKSGAWQYRLIEHHTIVINVFRINTDPDIQCTQHQGFTGFNILNTDIENIEIVCR